MTYILIFQPTFKDKLTPLEVQMRYKLHDEGEGGGTSGTFNVGGVSPEESLSPVIDPRQNLLALTDSASVQKNCGPDNVCVPQLALQHKM